MAAVLVNSTGPDPGWPVRGAGWGANPRRAADRL